MAEDDGKDRVRSIAQNAGCTQPNVKQTQGQCTATILTNRSSNQTVIRPFADRVQARAPSLRKGTRWMHRTTLTLEKSPSTEPLESSMQFAYSGKNIGRPPQRQPRCPSLQESHIEIGMNEQLHLHTHYSKEFLKRKIYHPNKIHYPSIINWSHNVTGQDMEEVLQRKNHTPSYWSSYTDVHSRLGLERGEGVARHPRPKIGYNLITGQWLNAEDDVHVRWMGQVSSVEKISDHHHLVSGNRTLSQARETGQGFLLG